MNDMWVKARFWLIRKLLSEDEKYLIYYSIETRVDHLRAVSVNERWANKENIEEDCADLLTLRHNTSIGN